MKTLIRIITPQTRGQWFASFGLWLLAFDGVFLGVLWTIGPIEAAPIWLWSIIGALVCAPFLTTALAMLRLHLRLQNKLYNASRTDLLTNMPNRRAFIDVVSKRLETCGGALLMIDVDRFKGVNDTYGHSFGDEVLRRMADNIKPVIPSSFYHARLGGEEFAVMLFDTNQQKIEDLGQVITTGIRVRPPGQRESIHVTCSVGACVADAGDSLSALMSVADTALYRAKDEGRARMVMAEADVSTPPLMIQLAS